jgi:hypothetical protein
MQNTPTWKTNTTRGVPGGHTLDNLDLLQLLESEADHVAAGLGEVSWGRAVPLLAAVSLTESTNTSALTKVHTASEGRCKTETRDKKDGRGVGNT